MNLKALTLRWFNERARRNCRRVAAAFEAFQVVYFSPHQQRFRNSMAQGLHSKTRFTGCSDPRLVPCLPSGSVPGELLSCAAWGLVPLYDGLATDWAARHHSQIKFAVLNQNVGHIVVFDLSHCGAIRAAHDAAPYEAVGAAGLAQGRSRGVSDGASPAARRSTAPGSIL